MNQSADARRPVGSAARVAPAKAAQPKVAVVILNWNDGAATMRLPQRTALNRLQQLQHDRRRQRFNRTVRPASATACVDLVINPTNLGYTGGVNVGIERAMAAGADYVWLLNSDATTRPDVLSRLVAAAEADERIGLVSPVFHDPDHPDVAEFCLGRFDPASRYATQTADPCIARAWQQNYPGSRSCFSAPPC